MLSGTLKVHDPPGAMVPPDRLTVDPTVTVDPVPQTFDSVVPPAVNPVRTASRLLLKAILVAVSLRLRLKIVNSTEALLLPGPAGSLRKFWRMISGSVSATSSDAPALPTAT